VACFLTLKRNGAFLGSVAGEEKKEEGENAILEGKDRTVTTSTDWLFFKGGKKEKKGGRRPASLRDEKVPRGGGPKRRRKKKKKEKKGGTDRSCSFPASKGKRWPSRDAWLKSTAKKKGRERRPEVRSYGVPTHCIASGRKEGRGEEKGGGQGDPS